MRWPAVGMSTSTLAAMSGRTPIVTNSVVPIANPPSARAPIATMTRAVLLGEGSVVESAPVTQRAKPLRRDGIPVRIGSAAAWGAPQPHELGRGRGPARRAGRQQFEAGLPHGDVVPGLGQRGEAEQQLGPAAVQDRLAEHGTHLLPGGR